MATATNHDTDDTAKTSHGKKSHEAALEISPTLAEAFHTLRKAGGVGEALETMSLGTKTIRALEAAGALEVTDKRRQGKGYAPTEVKLLVDAVEANADLEPKTRARRGTATPPRSKPAAVSASGDMPSVEEMQQLLAAIEHAEVAASEEVSKDAKKSLDEAWTAFSKLKPGAPDFAEAYDRFTQADAGLKNSSGDARKNAFAAVRSDSKHAHLAKYLRLLSDRT